MKVFVLGHNGMLGHVVVKFLKENRVDILESTNRWPSDEIKKEILDFNGDYIVNCIGAIPQRTKNFDVNWHLPIWLDMHSPCKVIHRGTDCEMDSDDYGISKSIAAEYINGIHNNNTKSLKTSILGPELDTKASLFEWFLNSQEDFVEGWSQHFWNGNTTLEWSKQCLQLMNHWDAYQKCTILASNCISKFELLNIIKRVFNKDINIRLDNLVTANKCLVADIETIEIESQLIEIKEWYYE